MTGNRTRRRSLDLEEILSFTHVGDDLLDRVRLIRTRWLPPATDGLTLGRFVFLRDDYIDRRASTLLAHEMVHVRQFAELGPIRFLQQYLTDYFRNLWKYRNHRRAYLEIPLEIEAREEASVWAERLNK